MVIDGGSCEPIQHDYCIAKVTHLSRKSASSLPFLVPPKTAQSKPDFPEGKCQHQENASLDFFPPIT